MTGIGATEPLPKELTGAPFCAVAEPISWSQKDTPETVVEIKEHNAVFAALCAAK